MRKLNRILQILLVFVLLFTMVGCGEDTASTGIQMLNDYGYGNGFNLKGLSSTSSANTIKVLQYGEEMDVEPSWEIAQWGSKYNLADGTEKSEGDWYTYACTGKALSVNRKTSAVKLTLHAQEDYGDTPRQQGQPWPHLLLSQGFGSITRLDEYEYINVEIDYTIDYMQNMMSEQQYIESIHTAQILFFMTVKNVDAYSADKGNYYWFGLPLYDYRYEYPIGHTQIDGGKEESTGKVIYTVDGKEYYDAPPTVGVKQSIKIDILPYVLDSFSALQEAGHFENSFLQHMVFGAMNIGYEMPGTFNSSFTLEKCSIQYELKEMY